jgi:hypothetical protein
MADLDHKDKQTIVLHSIDDAIVPHPNPVELINAAELFRSMRTRRS